MRFTDLVAVDQPPGDPTSAHRTPVITDTYLNRMADEPRNNGFVTSLVDRRRGRRMQATRRGFLRGSVTALAATTAASALHLFGPARKVQAQSAVVGAYPRRVLQYCPPYNSDDNCQPGCGSSPICTDCCSSDGWFRNEPARGYTLYPGGCGDGDIADAWLWRFKGVCGNCAEIEYRCSDGYVQTDTGPAPFICRVVTDCVPLAQGQAPGTPLADAARPTSWRPAGALELAVDNGTSVSISGWIADGSGVPVGMRLTANGTIVSFGTAAQPRPDIASSVRGAGPNSGFSVTFPVEPGPYTFCVDAISGVLTSTIGCVSLTVGSGRSVRGPAGRGTIAGVPAATPVPRPTPTPGPSREPGPSPTPGPTPSPAPTPGPTAEAGAIVLPVPGGPKSLSPTHGAVQVLRRSGPTTGFVSGWAGDPDTAAGAFIDITVDGRSIAVTRTGLPRPDVAQAFPALGSQTGFAVSFDLPEGSAVVCVDAVSPDDGRRQPLGCRELAVTEPDASDIASNRPTARGERAWTPATVYGAVEQIDMSAGGARVSGWAFDPNDHRRVITVQGRTIGGPDSTEVSSEPVQATVEHRAARATYGVDRPCGFELQLLLESGTHRIEVVALEGGVQVPLGEQTLVIP